MFTGLVEVCASVSRVKAEPPGARLYVREPTLAHDATSGESIAVNGCCLTVVAVERNDLVFEAGPETLQRTNLRQLAGESRVNLERSLRVGDRLGGHFVTGHVYGVGTVDRRDAQGEWSA